MTESLWVVGSVLWGPMGVVRLGGGGCRRWRGGFMLDPGLDPG